MNQVAHRKLAQLGTTAHETMCVSYGEAHGEDTINIKIKFNDNTDINISVSMGTGMGVSMFMGVSMCMGVDMDVKWALS